MQKVALDTNILIHGVQLQAGPGEEWKAERAAALLARLEAKEVIVVVPAPALAEYLAGLDDKDIHRSLRIVQKRFVIAPLDVAAATMAARLHRIARADQGQASLLDGGTANKRQLKADVFITAVAKIQGCTALFTAENNFPRVCRDAITVVTLNDAYSGLPLFQ